MNAHRVKILDRTDDDDVVVEVAHDLELVFLPAEDRFLDEYLRIGRSGEAVASYLLKFLRIISRAAASPAEGKGWTNDRGIARCFNDLASLFPSVCKTAFAARHADLVHRLFEQLAVLADPDGVDIRADHLDAELFEDSLLEQLHREVQSCLAANCRQHGVWTFFFDNCGQCLDGERFDVGLVGDLGVGHDRRRIGIDQHDLIAFLLERTAGLSAGIIKFAGLSDHDRARTYDQYLMYVVATWHFV